MGLKHITCRHQYFLVHMERISGIKFNTCIFKNVREHVKGSQIRSYSTYQDQNSSKSGQKIYTTLSHQYILDNKQKVGRNYNTCRFRDILQVVLRVRGRSHKVPRFSKHKQKCRRQGKRQYHCANNNLAPKTKSDKPYAFYENGICGNSTGCKSVTNSFNSVRGEIDFLTIYDDYKGKENCDLHSKNTRPNLGQDKEIDSDNTKRKIKVKSFTDNGIPRAHIAENEVNVGILTKVNRSINLQESYQDTCSCFYQRKRKDLEYEEFKNCASHYGSIGHRESCHQVNVSDISDDDSDFEFSNELDICRQNFVTDCNTLFQYLSGLEMRKGSYESISHSHINQSTGSDEGFVVEGSRKELSCMESADKISVNDLRKVMYATADRNLTRPEPLSELATNELCFINQFSLNIGEDNLSEENGEGLPVSKLTNGCQNDDCHTACCTFAVCIPESCKHPNDDAGEPGKRHLISSARISEGHRAVNLESLDENVGPYKTDLSEEKEQKLLTCYNLDEPQCLDSIMVDICSSNSRLVIHPLHDENRRLNTINRSSHVKSSSLPHVCVSERDTRLGLRWFHPKKGVKYVTRDASTKQSKDSNQAGRLYPLNWQSYVDAISLTELGVDDRDTDSTLGAIFKSVRREMTTWQRRYYIHQALARLTSDAENPFKQNVNLRWLLDWHWVSLESLQRFQHCMKYWLCPVSPKDYWKRVGTDLPPTVEESMSVEWMRLQTFQDYPPSAHGSPSRIAREGFYYTGQGTQTRCFSCGVTHGEWNYFDNPCEVHRRLSPDCPFLNGRHERYSNIPISYEGSGYIGGADRDSVPPPSGGIMSESREGPRVANTTDKDNIIQQQRNTGSGETTSMVQSHPVEESVQSEADNRPKFPEHVSIPSRIATFSHGWPPYLDQTPQQMAEAGFFFTGNQDYTRCYQCGGGLRNWEPGDNPWIEHCRWYPTCPHVQKGKGQRFVNAVLKKQAELLSTQRVESKRKAQYGIGSTDPLETLAAITLLEMGYPRDTVRNSILILRRQREPGAEITALEVLDFIWKEEDIERQRQEEEASRPRRPGDAQPPALPTLMEHLNLGGLPAVTQAAVPRSASITTTASSLTTAATTMASVTMAISSTSGTSGIITVSTSTTASGLTQSTTGSGQGQGKDECKGHSTSVGGNGTNRGESMQRYGVLDGSVGVESAAQNHEGSEQGGQRPSGAEEGQSEGPGAHAQAVAAAINEDEEFHSLDSKEMENKDFGELEEENKRLKEQTTCKICMENPIRVIFLPCGHLVCCATCAPAFRKCPICRKHIQQSVKTFL